MLSTEEKNCILEIAELISFNDLMSLASTVTNNTIEINTKEEAVKAILLHEKSLYSFLSRKKIKRNILYGYLHSKEVSFDSTVAKTSLIDLTVNLCQKQTSKSLVKHNETVSPLSPDDVINFGYQFTNWFYNRLNADFSQSEDTDTGLIENDFWSDCATSVLIPAGTNESQTFTASSASETLLLLRDLKEQHNLLFSPNFNSDGVKTRTEPHGLIIIMVYGTLHSNDRNCVGLFEHMFGLIRDPTTANNYKIKTMNLLLRSTFANESRAIKAV